jgi:hypothetical protein
VLIEQFRPIDAFAFEDDQRDSFGGGYVVERVSVDYQEIGVFARTDRADVVVGAEQARGIHGRGL